MGKDEGGEVVVHSDTFFGGEVLRLKVSEAALGASSGESFFDEDAVLLFGHLLTALANLGQLLGGGETGLIAQGGAGAAHHGEAAHSDLKKFVEIGGGDGKELDAFQNWNGWVFSLVREHVG